MSTVTHEVQHLEKIEKMKIGSMGRFELQQILEKQQETLNLCHVCE